MIIVYRVQNENFFLGIFRERARILGSRSRKLKIPRIREIIFNIFAIFIADVEAPLITNAAAELPTPAAQVIAKATAPEKT